MKRRFIAIVGLCAMAGTVLVFTAGAVTDRGSAGADALLERVKDLEQRVADLERRLQERETRGAIRVPRRVEPRQELPEGWQRREFNGQPYYIVPVEPEMGTTVRPGR
jgi:hypothetical protein